MPLRPEYSLGHSQYNAFLFAAVGEEKVGLPLTVLSALARLGVDPWQEAARLAGLPREAAAKAFAATIAKLPAGDWKVSDSEAIAARLVDWLPGRSASPIVPIASIRIRDQMKNTRPSAWLVGGALFVVLLFLAVYLQPDRNLESPGGREPATQQ